MSRPCFISYTLTRMTDQTETHITVSRQPDRKRANAAIVSRILQRGELVDLVGGAQYFLPLGEHVEVHGGEEGDVEEHDAEDDQGERERDIERIWKVDGEKILLKTWKRKGSFYRVFFL